jgi:outer membrane receptor protein involved in Fe transport
VNSADVDGGRLSALWRASDTLSLKLSAQLQDTHADGAADSFNRAGSGDLEQRYILPGHGSFDRKMRAYSATLTSQAGDVDLTAISGYSRNTLAQTGDASAGFGSATEEVFGVEGTIVHNTYETSKFTQEVRLSTALSSRVEWLLGAFYTHEKTFASQVMLPVDVVTLAPAGSWLNARFPSTYAEYAAFTDFTFQLTDRLDVQVGGRQGSNRQTYEELDVGPLVGGELSVPRGKSTDSSFTYLVTPRFKVSPNLMVYARFASGYRGGGPNSACALFPVLPCNFAPDETTNYEIGVKGSVPDRAFSFDASLYTIDWKDIQLQLQHPSNGFVYFANGTRARSRGVELSTDWRPARGMTISAWVAWNEAELTETLPLGGPVGSVGDRLPYSSPFSGSASVDQELALGATLTASFGGSISYVDERQSDFVASGGTRDTFASYTKLDLHAGVGSGSWTASLFVNNVTDRRGELSSNAAAPGAVVYIQPRTIGVSIAKNF